MGKIRNFSSLAVSGLRRAALDIAEAGLESIDTGNVVRRLVRLDADRLSVAGEEIDLSRAGRLVVVGVGKCSLEAARSLEKILGDKISAGIVLDIHEGSLQKMRAIAGDHPYSTKRNVDATRDIIGLLSECGEGDFILFIVSGGGSALLCQPKDHTVEEEKEIVQTLIHAGADIYKTNLVRKHLSLARGGFLASYAYPARSAAFIFSDVPGDRLEWVSSGPTYRDETTLADAKKVLDEYGVEQKVGFAVSLIETPKDEKYFARVRNVLACSAQTALKAMEEKARELGFSPTIKTEPLRGEAKEVGRDMALEIAAAEPKTALLQAGETTVTILTKGGKGGRNLEAALAGLAGIRAGCLVLPFASDGRDNTEYAGALCDIITKENAAKLGVSPEQYLERHASFEFFEKVGGYLETGDTGSNVSDLCIALHE